jgi:hypothetical protein
MSGEIPLQFLINYTKLAASLKPVVDVLSAQQACTEELTTVLDGIPALKLQVNLLSRNQVIRVEGRWG